jgi:hypothetical protein
MSLSITEQVADGVFSSQTFSARDGRTRLDDGPDGVTVVERLNGLPQALDQVRLIGRNDCGQTPL